MKDRASGAKGRATPHGPLPAPVADEDLGRQVRRLLAPFFKPRRFAPGRLLWREGSRAGMVLAIERGRVKIFREPSRGQPVTLYIFGPGEVFGFMPLIDGGPYPASARALDELEALVLTREQLAQALAQRPDLALALLSLLGRRLREAFERVEAGSTRGTQVRVAAALDALLSEQPGSASATALITLPVAASELAAAIGISAESFSRAVTRLARQGLVHRLGPRRLQILDRAGLRALAGGAVAPGGSGKSDAD